MVELITDAVLDTAKMLPILFLTYVFIHLCEKYISLAGKAALMAYSGGFGGNSATVRVFRHGIGIVCQKDNHRRHAYSGFSFNQ